MISYKNFCGHALLKFKTYPDDPYYQSYFEGKKRLFEIQVTHSSTCIVPYVTKSLPRYHYIYIFSFDFIQVQGKFSKSTEGQALFIGMEVPDPVTLGVVTKALSRVILGVVCTTTNNIRIIYFDAYI